jgi:hypothetical protein
MYIMAKKKNKKRKRRRQRTTPTEPAMSWMDTDGMHAIMPGEAPNRQKLDEMSKEYQRQIRNSPMWKEWVKQFGLKRAEEMLKECRVELR